MAKTKKEQYKANPFVQIIVALCFRECYFFVYTHAYFRQVKKPVQNPESRQPCLSRFGDSPRLISAVYISGPL